MRQNDVCYVRKCNPVVLSPVSLACVCRASSGVTHRYTQPAYTTGALKLSGLHTVTHWSEWLQTLDPQYWTKIRILPTVSVDFALNFTFRLVPHALPQCSGGIPCMWELKWRFFIMILQLSAKSTERPIMNQTWLFLSIFIYWAILSRNLHVNILWIIRRSCEFCGNTLQRKINLNVHILRY